MPLSPPYSSVSPSLTCSAIHHRITVSIFVSLCLEFADLFAELASLSCLSCDPPTQKAGHMHTLLNFPFLPFYYLLHISMILNQNQSDPLVMGMVVLLSSIPGDDELGSLGEGATVVHL